MAHRIAVSALAAACALNPLLSRAQDEQAQANAPGVEAPQFAPGFAARTPGSRLAIVPPEMELFSISAGGVEEPRADWTESAQKHFKAALQSRRAEFGPQVVELTDAQMDDFAEVLSLQKAVAESIYRHHTGNRLLQLASKDGKLDWSLGADTVRPLKERTGADYALFVWVRDTYASGERKAAMLGMALLGAISTGGEQNAYASLVDLRDGRVVWHHELSRASGDLRDAASAAETADALLKGFPALR